MKDEDHKQNQSVDIAEASARDVQQSAVPAGNSAQHDDAGSVPVATTSAPVPAAPQAGMPQIADDTDLIEKEWIDKAKEIVAQTAHDPYLQNQEINKMRSDYLKKRYNKEIKPSE